MKEPYQAEISIRFCDLWKHVCNGAWMLDKTWPGDVYTIQAKCIEVTLTVEDVKVVQLSSLKRGMSETQNELETRCKNGNTKAEGSDGLCNFMLITNESVSLN
jgi:hypothetical protein